MADTSDIRRRVAALEQNNGVIHRILSRIVNVMWSRKRFRRSRLLSKKQAEAFRAQMESHGVEDDDSKDGRDAKSRANGR